MTDIPTLANGGAPASPSPPAPAAAPPVSTAPPASSPRPSAPPNPRSVGHSPARDTYEQIRHAQDQARGEAPPGDQPAPPAAADQQQPAATGEKVKIGKYEISETELGEMMQRQAVEDQRRLTMPTKPEEYKAELPADYKAPGGVEYRFDVNDPSLVAARNLAHAKGWSQQDF
jgi:hypothetical protein